MKMYKSIKLLKNRLFFIYIIFLVSCENNKQEHRIKFGQEVYQNGTLKSKGALINDKKFGLWIFYNEDSSVSSEYLYYNDSLHGKYIGYFEAGGDTLIIGNYVNGLEEGEWRSFYGNNLLAKKAYYKRGKKVGVWEYYKEDGRLYKKVSYNGEEEKILFDKE
jgi:antitoxin component YwqK of YwqJK toxin-antitoxin module